MTYSHFTLDERIELQTCLARGMGCQEIAWRVGKDPTSVSREIARSRLYEGVRYGYEKPSLRCRPLQGVSTYLLVPSRRLFSSSDSSISSSRASISAFHLRAPLEETS